MLHAVLTDKAPKPGGHYSQAIVHNGVVYVSGQLPIDPLTGEKNQGSIEEQAMQVLDNVRSVLEAAGSDMNHLLKTTVYISDIGLWGRFNQVYKDALGDHKPARAVVPTKDLHYGFLVEIDAIAAVKEG
ncbi:MAG: Rid family detoxifying hydrolase [Rhodothermaceae bacterium]|nr:Rid family detoxifying hydrolase [Rhodothermaceae bacterium]